MTPRTLWLIVIKALGIWLILQGLGIIPQLLTTGFAFYNQGYNQSIFTILMIVLISIAAYCFVIWGFLFKTEKVINLLKLDEGFSEARLDFKIHRSTVLRIIVILIGGIIVIDSLPQLCRNVFTFLQYRSFSFQNPLTATFAFYFVKLLIGVFLVFNNRMIVNAIEHLKSKPN